MSGARTGCLNRWAAVAAILLVTGAAMAQNRFDYCLLCHGDNANGNYGIRAPKLSGMEPWYLARQLDNFAAGVRGAAAEDSAGHEMMPVGARVKQEDALLAAVEYIGTLQAKKPAPTVSGNVARGRQLYQTCVACHGARGQGNAGLQAPGLAARSDWYLVTQLRNYKAGLRGVDERDAPGAQMRAITNTLPDDQAINDVIAYINTF
jgi:cytochrome c553